MRVLLLGDTSFVARGFRQLLQSHGASVLAVQQNADTDDDPTVFVGEVTRLTKLELPPGRFDAVINFVMLRDGGVDENLAYIDEVLTFVKQHEIPHLLHLSSISTYADDQTLVTEYSRIEEDVSKRDPQTQVEIAADRRLLDALGTRGGLTLVRPGFLLGTGLCDPIAGSGARVPGNNLLVFGSSNAIVPLVTRQQVHDALWASLRKGPPLETQVLLLVDRDSPTRAEYLRHCTRGLGAARRIIRLGSASWLAASAVVRLAETATKTQAAAWREIRRLTKVRTYDGTVTETLLGVPIKVNWQKELQHSLPGQVPNIELPKPLQHLGTLPPRNVALIGCDTLAERHHLPALGRLGLDANVSAYDLAPGKTEHLDVRPIPIRIESAPLVIVSSPGPARSDVPPRLPRGWESVLIQAPLCVDERQLGEWLTFAESRPGFTGVIHNYRTKVNVQQMLLFLHTYNPGRLLSADVTLQSPPPFTGGRTGEGERSSWLMGQAVHLLDVAMMFDPGDWTPRDVRFSLNHVGEADFIGGVMSGEKYDVSFNLRQGFSPSAARVHLVFQNYRLLLSFGPDVFNAEMSGDDFATSFIRGARQAKGLLREVTEQLRGTDSDRSYELLIAAAANGEGFSVQSVAGFYRGVLTLARQVYGAQSEPESGRAPKAHAV